MSIQDPQSELELTSTANIDGAIADMWDHHHTRFPLSIYNITSARGSASGVFAYSFIAQLQGFRAVFWAMVGTTGVYFLLFCIVLSETRHGALLRRRTERRTWEYEPRCARRNVHPKHETVAHGVSRTVFPLPISQRRSLSSVLHIMATFLDWLFCSMGHLRWYLGIWDTGSIRSR